MGPKKNTFFFVNKDSSSESLTQSGTYEKTRILSHVQINRRRADKTKARQIHWTVSDPTLSGSSDSSDDVESSSSSPSDLQIALQQTRLPQVYPAANATDPFHCTSAGDQAYLHTMLHHGISQTAHLVFLANAFAPQSEVLQRKSMRHQNAITERLRRCVTDKMLMDASLASCAGSLSWLIDRRQLSSETFIERALPAVRARIAALDKPADTWLLQSIYCLAITELWNGSPNLLNRRQKPVGTSDKARLRACRTHVKALLELMSDSGTLVDAYVLECVILVDKYLSITELTAPMLDLWWDPGPTPPKGPGEFLAVDRDLLSIGGAFFTSALQSHALLAIIQDILTFIQIAQHAWSKAVMTTEKESWLFLRQHSLFHRLLALQGLEGIAECVRLAVLLFMCNVNEYEGAHAAAATVTEHLRKALLANGPWHELLRSGDSRLLFWIFATGGMTPRECPQRQWFRERMSVVAHAAGIALDETSFKEVLEGYFYLHNRQRVELKELSSVILSQSEGVEITLRQVTLAKGTSR